MYSVPGDLAVRAPAASCAWWDQPRDGCKWTVLSRCRLGTDSADLYSGTRGEAGPVRTVRANLVYVLISGAGVVASPSTMASPHWGWAVGAMLSPYMPRPGKAHCLLMS